MLTAVHRVSRHCGQRPRQLASCACSSVSAAVKRRAHGVRPPSRLALSLPSPPGARERCSHAAYGQSSSRPRLRWCASARRLPGPRSSGVGAWRGVAGLGRAASGPRDTRLRPGAGKPAHASTAWRSPSTRNGPLCARRRHAPAGAQVPVPAFALPCPSQAAAAWRVWGAGGSDRSLAVTHRHVTGRTGRRHCDPAGARTARRRASRAARARVGLGPSPLPPSPSAGHQSAPGGAACPGRA